MVSVGGRFKFIPCFSQDRFQLEANSDNNGGAQYFFFCLSFFCVYLVLFFCFDVKFNKSPRKLTLTDISHSMACFIVLVVVLLVVVIEWRW